MSVVLSCQVCGHWLQQPRSLRQMSRASAKGAEQRAMAAWGTVALAWGLDEASQPRSYFMGL